MKRRFRFRRLFKWSGAAVCLLLVLAALADLRRSFGWQTQYFRVIVAAGSLQVYCDTDGQWAATGFFVREAYPSIEQAWEAWSRNGGLPGWATVGSWGIVSLPLWILFILVGIPTLVLWRLDRRRVLPGCCAKCGYNLTGNVSGVCPECGTTFGA